MFKPTLPEKSVEDLVNSLSQDCVTNSDLVRFKYASINPSEVVKKPRQT